MNDTEILHDILWNASPKMWEPDERRIAEFEFGLDTSWHEPARLKVRFNFADHTLEILEYTPSVRRNPVEKDAKL